MLRDKRMISFNGGQIKAGQAGLISLLTGLHIKMEGHHLLEGRVDQSIRFYGVDGFGVFFYRYRRYRRDIPFPLR